MKEDPNNLETLLDAQALIDIVIQQGWSESRLFAACKVLAAVDRQKRILKHRKPAGFNPH
jgi:hypothetical protein